VSDDPENFKRVGGNILRNEIENIELVKVDEL